MLGGASHIQHDSRQLWRQHTDKSIGPRPGLIAGSQGGDILRTNTFGDDNAAVRGANDEQLDFIWRKTKLVMVAGSGIERETGIGN